MVKVNEVTYTSFLTPTYFAMRHTTSVSVINDTRGEFVCIAATSLPPKWQSQDKKINNYDMYEKNCLQYVQYVTGGQGSDGT